MCRVVITCLCCLITFKSLAQELHFKNLTAEKVLDKHAILSITQDINGRLWFGGANNLFVYNSFNVINLTHQDTVYSSLGYIVKLATNSHNDLFIGTSNGLRTINIDHNQRRSFFNADKISSVPILDLQYIAEKMFICTNEGLFLANKINDKYDIVPVTTNRTISTIHQIDSTTYVLGTSNGIEIVDIDIAGTTRIAYTEQITLKELSRPNESITTLFKHDNTIWIGTKYHGIILYDIMKKQLNYLNERNSNLLSNNIRKIICSPQGTLWVGTLKGLSVYNGEHTFINHKHSLNTTNSLSQNSIYDIFLDHQKIMWLGTYFGGLNAYYPNTAQFDLFSTKTSSTGQTNSDIISSISESDEGYWIGTEEEGINFLDKKNSTIKLYPQYSRSNLIKDVAAKNNKLYIAQYNGGYSVVDMKTGDAQHFTIDTNTYSLTNNVFSINVDDDHTVYLGTNTGLFVKKKDQHSPILIRNTPNSIIEKIRIDSSHQIYILDNGSIYKKKKRSDSFDLLESTRPIAVNDFFLHGNEIWTTTRHNIYQISDESPPQLIAAFKENNLGAIARHNNNLWIASENGLIYIDLSTKYTNILTREDGLPVTNIRNAKLYIDSNDNLFITTYHGLVRLDLRSLIFNTYIPTAILTGITANDQRLSSDRINRGGQNNNTYKIILNHDEKFLNITFSSSNFINPQKNRYRYKIEGFDNHWVEVSTPDIRYTNLPTGDHTLTIYVSNNDMIWSEEPLIIHIKIKPPFWKTWWAYLLYLMITLVLIYFTIHFIVERQLLRKSEHEYEKKIQFFTRISHEIRTPLTLIATPLDDILEETSDQPKIHQKISRLKKNAHKLLSVVNELLDFKKFDDRKQTLKKTNVSFKEYIEDFFYLFHDFAHTKNLNYYIHKLDNPGIIAIDSAQFDKVMFNLLSNAIKYSNQDGTVSLELISLEKSIQIRVLDNGIGIADTNHFQIFEEYYRENHTEDILGTGIGLALTKEIVEQHHGTITCETRTMNNENWTIFVIELPKDRFEESFTNQEDLSTRAMTEAISSPEPIYSRNLPHSESVLIVEDNKDMQEIIVEMFQNHFQIITANDGEEALAKAQKHLPDIIISDIMLPKVNGIDLCKEIKHNITTSHIPFILLTALDENSTQTEALTAGANIYLTKPFDKVQLYHTVNNLLKVSKNNREGFQIKRSTSSNQVDQQFINTLDKIIEENLHSDKLDVSFITKSMGMSAPILYKKLKAITNYSLNNYVKMYRLNKAKDLLSSNMNINEVAYAVGFSDRKYFSKEFKKVFGINPSEYLAGKDLPKE